MNRRIVSIGFAAACAVALGGAVPLAQSVPAQFVVSGAAAEKIQDFTTINLATAERLAELCEKAVSARGDGAHSIMILDNDGNHVYSDRMDGQGYQNIVTAEFKARTALEGARTEQDLHEPRAAGCHAGIPHVSARLLSRRGRAADRRSTSR